MSTAQAKPLAEFGAWPGSGSHHGTRRVPWRFEYDMTHLFLWCWS
jgi:hypothetical protein